VNPEVSSIRDADRIIGMLDAKTLRAENGQCIDKHLLLTRYDPARARRGEIMTVENVLEILSIPLLGIIPESGEVLLSSNVGAPVTLGSPASAPAQAYLDAARRLKGEGTVVTASEKPRLLHRLFTRRAA
jgi:septum site-determining protein MinD